MFKHILFKITTFISQLSVGILLIGLMLLVFSLLWTGLVYLTNELGNQADSTNIEQVQTP